MATKQATQKAPQAQQPQAQQPQAQQPQAQQPQAPKQWAPRTGKIHQLRANSMLAQACDLLAQPGGATVAQLAAQSGKPVGYYNNTWFLAFARLAGYGVQANPQPNGAPTTYTLIYPAGMQAPKAHLQPQAKQAPAQAPSAPQA